MRLSLQCERRIYDVDVSGADPIEVRAGLSILLERSNGG
jgi:hypothetical protein